MSAQGILIAGGYGVVGGRIAAELAPDYPDQVIVAGRNLDLAKATATVIGHGACGRALDVTVPSSIAAALGNVAVVVSCIDQPGRRLLHAAVERGLRYTDISPHLTELGRGAAYEKIDDAARASGARVVLGTGIVPGIANVMVRALAETLGGAEEIETSLLLSASDTAGAASFDYFLQELSMPFEVHVDGADHPARAFSDPRLVEFPPPVGERPAYLFPFSDQVLYPRTMGVRTALTRLAIEPTRLAKLLAFLTRTGAADLIAREPVRHAIAKQRKHLATRADTQFALR
ncbi:MAG TPA: saccharopine dehydrogenase NADP-binding domain-containing protein, partial [Gemmatimonadales bacterium]|nr:saccharopine dehydrogenase NADP-binding domain-containing protein [Gemmatimonadales bacterium]